MSLAVKIVLGIMVVGPLLYIGACSSITHQHERGFEQVKVGDTEGQVIQAMGQPADIETASGVRWAKYGAPECQAPCARRLWFPNKLSMVGESWAVTLDGSGRVIDTAHVVSP